MQSSIAIESENGFRALFEYATIGIIVLSESGRIELVNPSAEKLFEYGNAELIGKTIEILIPDKFKNKHINHREKYIKRPKARPMGLGLDLFALKKDGKTFPVEISLGNYMLGSEKMTMAFITDITQRKEAEDNLRKINEELEYRIDERTLELTEALNREKELNDMKSRFVSMASHEFRTPLSTILSSISLVERYSETGQEEKKNKHIARVKSSVKNLTDILNDFLSLDKLEQGKVEVDFSPFDLYHLSTEIVEEYNNMLKPGQKISFDYNGENEIIQDKKILRNILLNLLSNASKYSDDNMEIDLTINVLNNRVEIKIKDNGIGIPEDEQVNLFSKFYRARNAVNIQGTGLGLNIVKRYVELMNGDIKFMSKLNNGTVFTIEFPQNNI